MFSAAPLNTAALNSAAVVYEVQFASAVGVAVTASASAVRIRGFRATAEIAVSASARTFGRSMRSSVAITTTATVRPAALRGFSGVAVLSVSGSASLPAVVDFQAVAAISLTASATLGGRLFESQVSLALQATAAPTRWRIFGSDVSLQASQTSALARVAGLSTAADLSVVATPADVDVIRGGVRIVGLSAVAAIGVQAQAAMVRVARLAAQPVLSVSSSSNATRLRPLRTSVSLALVCEASLTVRRPDGSDVQLSVTAQASLQRIVGLRAVALLRVEANAPRIVLTPAALRSSVDLGVTATTPGFDRLRGFVAQALISLVATASMEVRTPKVFSAQASISLTAAASMTTARSWSIFATISLTAVADLRTNIFDDEPDYRSFVVPRQEFVFSVPRQEFTAYISSDVQSMITFTKQPAERLAYDFEFQEWFEELQGDDIEAASVEVISASVGAINALVVEQPLRINSPSTRVKIWIEGGLNGVRYKLTLTIDTGGGRRKTVDFYLRVKEL